jgi:isoleucyl-tRNA synthetase
MLNDRDDWCISRQRSWGVPIPVFYDVDTDEIHLDQSIIQHLQSLFMEHGTDIWWQASVDVLLPQQWRSHSQRLRKGMDTLDVWFDSGVSWVYLHDVLASQE